jgi:hypothetical protein
MSHPWFTIIVGAFCVLFIYVLGKVFIDNEKRFSDLRSALESLLRISACRCNNAGTCAHCKATKVLEKELKIAREMKESGERYDAGQNF